MARIDDIQVGQSAELAKTVTETDIALFAGVTGDFNAVHIDAAAAAQSRFGERIAHGMLSAGFISAGMENELANLSPPMSNVRRVTGEGLTASTIAR